MIKSINRFWFWMTVAALASSAPLLLVSLFPSSYRVFPLGYFLIYHSIVELLCVLLGLQIFILSWITHSKAENPRSLFIGTSFLGVALLVSLHVLAYPGMPGGLVPVSIQNSLYYSLAARLWAMGALLAASFILVKKETAPPSPITPEKFSKLFFSRYFLLGTVMALVALVVGLEAIFGSYLPPLYIAGEGQTPLKIVLEYVVMALALAAFVFYRKLYIKSQERSLPYLMLGLILVMVSELCFTFYGSYTDTYIALGHAYLLAAFGLFFHALFISGIRLPYLSLEAAHQHLRQSEEKYRQLIQSASDAIFLADAETGILLEANPKAEELIGLPREKIVGMRFTQLLPPEEPEAYRQIFQEHVLDGKRVTTEEIYVCHQDGRRIPVEVSTNTFELGGQKVIQGIFRDLTERRRAEGEIRLLHSLTQAVSEAEDLHSATEIILQKVCETTGWAYGECWMPNPDQSHLELFRTWYGRLPGLEKFHQASVEFKFPPGVGLPGRAWASKKLVWMEDITVDRSFLRGSLAKEVGLVAGMAIPVPAGEDVVAVLVFFTAQPKKEDQAQMELISTITIQLGGLFQRKQAEEALRASEAKFRGLIEFAPDAMVIVNQEGRIEIVNQQAEKLFGYTREELYDQLIETLLPERFRAAHTEHRARYFTNPSPRQMSTGLELYGRRQDGSEFPVDVSLSPLETEAGLLVVGAVRDVTERKQAEEEIERSYDIQRVLNSILQLSLTELSLDEILEQTLDILLSVPWLAFEARGGLFLTENDSEVLILKAQKGFADPQQESCARVPFGKCLCGQAALIQKIQYADRIDERHEIQYGGILTHGHYCVPICLGNKVLGVLNMYLKEGHLQNEREIAFLEAVANILAGIIQRRKSEETIEKSEARLAKAQEIAQLGNWDWHIQTNRLYWSDEIYRIFGLKPQEFGATYEAFLNSVHPDDRGFVKASVQEALDRKKPYNIEHRIVLPDGRERFVHEQAELYFDDRGKPLRMVGTVQDLSERKRLEAQLLQAQKMEAVGTLAGGVAHDFNNMLTAMTVNLELAKAKLIKGESHEAHLEEIDNVIQRAAALTRQLLAFSRRQIIQPVPLDLNDTLTEMSKMLSRLLGEHIEMEPRLGGKLWTVKVDPGQIEQVIMNLCVNARDAMPKGGKLFLVTHNINLEDDYLNMHPGVEKGQYVLLEVCDTGQGMDEATLTHIFEPFFTTKETGKGTGLGLAMVYGIIKQHQGHINVYSEPGQGITFKIYLPRSEEKAVAAEIKAEFQAEGGQETILLAEDEEALRQAISNILEMFGYTVLAAQDGQEAVEIFEREKDRIDLVVLDAVMPKKGGKEVAEWIHKQKPEQKILFSSGYSAEGFTEGFTLPEGIHFIQKPYRAKDLAKKVREVLEG